MPEVLIVWVRIAFEDLLSYQSIYSSFHGLYYYYIALSFMSTYINFICSNIPLSV